MIKLGVLKSNLVKSKIQFLGIPVALLSLEVYFGMLFGYLMGKLFAGKKTGHKGVFSSIAFNIGKYQIHLHHWLIGLGVLISGIWYISLPFPKFSFGFLGGCIYHGIFSYSDWHKILKKKPLFSQKNFKFIQQFYEARNKKISRSDLDRKERTNIQN